jgi:hypothetical protein
MHYSRAIMAAAVVSGLLMLPASWLGNLDAQQPAALPEISPKILAFLKPVEPAAGDTELQKKLKERHNAAVKLLEERINEYKKGIRDVSVVFEAGRLAADAKLELDPSPQARIAVLEQTLEAAKELEASLQKQLDKGFGSKGDLQRARLARLNVEVDLIKAKQK